jgi:hypothetical protein
MVVGVSRRQSEREAYRVGARRGGWAARIGLGVDSGLSWGVRRSRWQEMGSLQDRGFVF